jgi:hypothetical protein
MRFSSRRTEKKITKLAVQNADKTTQKCMIELQKYQAAKAELKAQQAIECPLNASVYTKTWCVLYTNRKR